jgi:hypothetical protein
MFPLVALLLLYVNGRIFAFARRLRLTSMPPVFLKARSTAPLTLVRLSTLLLITLVQVEFTNAETDGHQSPGDYPLIEITPVGNPIEMAGEKIQLAPHFAAHNTDQHKLYIRLTNNLYTVDLQSGRWSEPEIIPDQVPAVMGYSPFHETLMFWDAAVGRVFQRFGRDNYQRIDRSSDHRNQYDHAPWIDHQTGHIYAFGGYGNFLRKNMITKFDPVQLAWNIENMEDYLHHPVPTTNGIVIQDRHNGKVFIITHKELMSDGIPEMFKDGSELVRHEAVWEYMQQDNRWFRRHIIDASKQQQLFYVHQQSFHPNGRFFLLPVNDIDFQLLLYDTRKHRFFDTRSILPESSMSDVIGAKLTWCDRDEVFYAMLAQHPGDSQTNIFQLYRISIPDPDVFLKRVRAESLATGNYIDVLTILGLLGSGLLLMGFIWYRRKEKQSKALKALDNLSVTPKFVIRFTADGNLAGIEYSGRHVTGFHEIDRTFLCLLAANSRTSDSFVSADTIDETLWPNHPNPDHSRRVRATMLNRIERIFQEIAPHIPTDPHSGIILRRPATSDKRKFEYRLNDEYVTVISMDRESAADSPLTPGESS